MDMISLRDEILQLMELKREGGYWDFKQSWYEDKAELLLDIICMANNQENRTAYIILGVEDHTMKVLGVESDRKRMNLNELSQFVTGKRFAIYIPEIDLQSVIIENHEVDVIIIKNSNHTPYYLEMDYTDKKFKKAYPDDATTVAHGRIYLRLNDRKAGVDHAAPHFCIEYLWKKRFGIDLSAKEKLMILLDDIDKWEFDWANKKYAYHVDFPEFRIVQVEDMKQAWWPSAAFYAHPVMHIAPLHIMYHNTIIAETELWCYDQFRRYLPKAENCSVRGKRDFCYSYYLLDSIEGKLLSIFTKGTNDISSREPCYYQLLIFIDASEKADFDRYLDEHFDDYEDNVINEQYYYQICEDIESNGGGQIYSAFQVAKASKIYQDWVAKKQAQVGA